MTYIRMPYFTVVVGPELLPSLCAIIAGSTDVARHQSLFVLLSSEEQEIGNVDYSCIRSNLAYHSHENRANSQFQTLVQKFKPFFWVLCIECTKCQ
jgi:hypothetical protein